MKVRTGKWNVRKDAKPEDMKSIMFPDRINLYRCLNLRTEEGIY